MNSFYYSELLIRIRNLQKQINDLQEEIHHIKTICGVDVVVPEWADREEYIKEYEQTYGKIRNIKE